MVKHKRLSGKRTFKFYDSYNSFICENNIFLDRMEDVLPAKLVS